MLDALALKSQDAARAAFFLEIVADQLKRGNTPIEITDRKALLDSLADQIVTAVGVGYCAGMDIPVALERVNISNWTKIFNNKVVKDSNGKIIKPEGYKPPDLEGLY